MSAILTIGFIAKSFMVVMINGSFGVGKTTVAKLLCRALPGSVIYDPEWFGFILKRIPRWFYPRNSKPDDYQHSKLWRSSVPRGVRTFQNIGRDPVIVPMAFCDRVYFDEVIAGISRFERNLKLFCLRAELETIKQRLVGRGDRIEGAGREWIARRIVECDAAHRDPHFGEPVETENRTPAEICEEIVLRLRRGTVKAL